MLQGIRQIIFDDSEQGADLQMTPVILDAIEREGVIAEHDLGAIEAYLKGLAAFERRALTEDAVRQFHQNKAKVLSIEGLSENTLRQLHTIAGAIPLTMQSAHATQAPDQPDAPTTHYAPLRSVPEQAAADISAPPPPRLPTPFGVSLKTWGTSYTAGRFSEPLRAIMHGGNVGHAAMEMRLPNNKKTQEMIDKYGKTVPFHVTREPLPPPLNQGEHKEVLVIYFSWWNKEKLSEPSIKASKDGPGFRLKTRDQDLNDEWAGHEVEFSERFKHLHDEQYDMEVKGELWGAKKRTIKLSVWERGLVHPDHLERIAAFHLQDVMSSLSNILESISKNQSKITDERKNKLLSMALDRINDKIEKLGIYRTGDESSPIDVELKKLATLRDHVKANREGSENTLDELLGQCQGEHSLYAARAQQLKIPMSESDPKFKAVNEAYFLSHEEYLYMLVNFDNARQLNMYNEGLESINTLLQNTTQLTVEAINASLSRIISDNLKTQFEQNANNQPEIIAILQSLKEDVESKVPALEKDVSERLEQFKSWEYQRVSKGHQPDHEVNLPVKHESLLGHTPLHSDIEHEALDVEQMFQKMEKLVERKGKYKFLTKNCSSTVEDIIGAGASQTSSKKYFNRHRFRIVTPQSIFKKIVKVQNNIYQTAALKGALSREPLSNESTSILRRLRIKISSLKQSSPFSRFKSNFAEPASEYNASPTVQASSEDVPQPEAASPAEAQPGAGAYAPLPQPEQPSASPDTAPPAHVESGASAYAPLAQAHETHNGPAADSSTEDGIRSAADPYPEESIRQLLQKQEAEILAILNRDVGGFSRSAQQRQERKADVDLQNKKDLEEKAPNLGMDIYDRMDATDDEWTIAEAHASTAQNEDFKIDHDEAHGLNHSFIKAGDTLLCIERGVRLGAGVEGQTKLAYDKDHNPYAVKVIQKKDGSKDYQVMPYAGVRLGDLANLPASEKMKILPKIIEALQDIHDNNIIHFDLNENNILVSVTQTGEYKVEIIDFGKSILLNENDVDGRVYTFGENEFRMHDEVNMELIAPETLPTMENNSGKCVPDLVALSSINKNNLYVSKESDIYQLGKMLQTTFCADIPELNDLFVAMRSEVPEGRPSLDEIKLDFMLGTYEPSQPTIPEQDAQAQAIPAKGAQNYAPFPQKGTQAAAQADPSSYSPMLKREQPQPLDLAVQAVKAALESKNKGRFEVSITGNAQDGFTITASCDGSPPREKMMTSQSLKSLVESYQQTLKWQAAGVSSSEAEAVRAAPSVDANSERRPMVPGFQSGARGNVEQARERKTGSQMLSEDESGPTAPSRRSTKPR